MKQFIKITHHRWMSTGFFGVGPSKLVPVSEDLLNVQKIQGIDQRTYKGTTYCKIYYEGSRYSIFKGTLYELERLMEI